MILEQQISERVEKMKIGETIEFKGYRVYKSPRGYKVTHGKDIKYYQRGTTVARILHEAINVKVMKPQTKPERIRKEKTGDHSVSAMIMLIVELVAIALYAFAALNIHQLPELSGFLGTNLPYLLLGVAFMFGLVATVTSRGKVSRVVVIVNVVLLLSLVGWIYKGISETVPVIPTDELSDYVLSSPLSQMIAVIVLVLISNVFKPRKREV